MILVDGNEATIEHPMQCAGQGKPVLHDIGSKIRNRPDMSRIDFGPSSAVAERQARQGAATSIGNLDLPRKGLLTEGTARENLSTVRG